MFRSWAATDGRCDPVVWYDITRPLNREVVVYPGDHVPSMVQEDRGRYLLSSLHLSSHSGTHIDAPSHYIQGGACIDAIPFEQLTGNCRIIAIPGRDTEIMAGTLEPAMAGTKKILLKTWYSEEKEFHAEYPGLSPGAADAIVSAGIECVGIDSPSIEPYHGDGSVHRTLLSHGVVIIELLSLENVKVGNYWMVALPMRLEGLDGSPCRVLLRDAAPG